MIYLKQLLDFFLYSNLFISVCAAAMTAETYLLIHSEINWLYIAFVFACTLALYNFPVLVENNFSYERPGRHNWISGNKKLIVALFALASISTGPLIFFFPFRFILWFVPVAVLSFAYFFPQTQLRSITGLKAGIVAFVWTCVIVVFPLLLISDFDSFPVLEEESRAILLQNFLFLFPLSVIFNVRDIATDRKAGVRTIPVIYGTKATIAVCLVSLALFSVIVVLSPSLREERTGLFISAAAAATLILFASERRSDYYYSFWIDGMILLQAGLVIF